MDVVSVLSCFLVACVLLSARLHECGGQRVLHGEIRQQQPWHVAGEQSSVAPKLRLHPEANAKSSVPSPPTIHPEQDGVMVGRADGHGADRTTPGPGRNSPQSGSAQLLQFGYRQSAGDQVTNRQSAGDLAGAEQSGNSPAVRRTAQTPGAQPVMPAPIGNIFSYKQQHGPIPGLIQEQWNRGGRLNLTCQKVLWPMHLLELCDFDPLYRIVGQRAPSVLELLKLTRRYALIYSQIRSEASELCADAAVEHICHQQVPRCEQTAVNGEAVWSIEGVTTQCYKVHRYCYATAARRVLSEMKICVDGGAAITGRYELNTCKPLAAVQRPAAGGYGPGMASSCASNVSPGIRVPDFQRPLYRNNWDRNGQLGQLQRAASRGMLPIACRQLVQRFVCAPEQMCSSNGRRVIPGRTKKQCLAVRDCLQQSRFPLRMDCGTLPSQQSVAELDLRPSRHDTIGMKKGPRVFFSAASPVLNINSREMPIFSTLLANLWVLLRH